jgi:hypothetical protein
MVVDKCLNLTQRIYHIEFRYYYLITGVWTKFGRRPSPRVVQKKYCTEGDGLRPNFVQTPVDEKLKKSNLLL